MFGFRLTQEFTNSGFSGGTINASSLGHSFDVGTALEAGEGVIATEDEVLAGVLRSYPALEEIPEGDIPEGVNASVAPGREELATEQIGPPTLQSGQVPSEWMQQAGAGEIPAQHADPAATPEEEIKAGEDVSGSTDVNQPDPGVTSAQAGEGDPSEQAAGEEQSSQSGRSSRF